MRCLDLRCYCKVMLLTRSISCRCSLSKDLARQTSIAVVTRQNSAALLTSTSVSLPRPSTAKLCSFRLRQPSASTNDREPSQICVAHSAAQLSLEAIIAALTEADHQASVAVSWQKQQTMVPVSCQRYARIILPELANEKVALVGTNVRAKQKIKIKFPAGESNPDLSCSIRRRPAFEKAVY